MLKQIDLEELLTGDYVPVDVRSRERFMAGSLKGAVSLPLSEFSQHLEELPKERTICVYCDSGLISPTVGQLLQELDFDVCELAGGLERYF